MSLKIPTNLLHAAFFFVDIVGLSNPSLSTNTQTLKIKALNEIIGKCATFKSTPNEEKLILPTGDGMVIAFLNGLEKPLNLSKEIHEKLEQYNKTKTMDKLLIRIGCHSGNIFVVEDILGSKNLWGPGIILARRVMDIGDAGHILMTSSMAESLLELSNDYENIIHPIHDYTIKHGEELLLFSVYGDNFGNSQRPQKGTKEKPKLIDDIRKTDKTISFNEIEFSLVLKNPKTNLLQIKRTYNFLNTSEEPVYEVLNGILTNVEKSFAELNVNAYDENNQPLKIKGINVDSQLRKEFTIKLNEPVFQGDQNRMYSVIHETEEPDSKFENMFLINAKKLTFTFNYPTIEGIKIPKLYLIRSQDREKRLIHTSKVQQGKRIQVKWKIDDGVSEKDIIRLEW